jgi:hypothetical protein
MTKTEIKSAQCEQQKAFDLQEKKSEAALLKQFKQKAKFEALSTAKFLKTTMTDGSGDQRHMTDKEIVKVADSIYQWLIKS